MLIHSIETTLKYGVQGESEIEKTASLLDYAASDKETLLHFVTFYMD